MLSDGAGHCVKNRFYSLLYDWCLHCLTRKQFFAFFFSSLSLFFLWASFSWSWQKRSQVVIVVVVVVVVIVIVVIVFYWQLSVELIFSATQKNHDDYVVVVCVVVVVIDVVIVVVVVVVVIGPLTEIHVRKKRNSSSKKFRAQIRNEISKLLFWVLARVRLFHLWDPSTEHALVSRPDDLRKHTCIGSRSGDSHNPAPPCLALYN